MRQNPTLQKLDNFKKKITNQTSPRGYVKSVLERLGETIDTSNMNALGLSSHLRRIKDPSTMQIWKEVTEEYVATISMDPITMASIEQDDDEDTGEDYCVVTTSLRQIV